MSDDASLYTGKSVEDLINLLHERDAVISQYKKFVGDLVDKGRELLSDSTRKRGRRTQQTEECHDEGASDDGQHMLGQWRVDRILGDAVTSQQVDVFRFENIDGEEVVARYFLPKDALCLARGPIAGKPDDALKNKVSYDAFDVVYQVLPTI